MSVTDIRAEGGAGSSGSRRGDGKPGQTDSQPRIGRVTATPAALTALARLREQRGPVILYQFGGDPGSSLPLCFDQEDLLIGDGDVLLGWAGDCPVYIDDRHYEVWQHARLIIDVAEGEPEGFSLPAGDDWHFVTKCRVFSPRELAALRSADAREPSSP